MSRLLRRSLLLRLGLLMAGISLLAVTAMGVSAVVSEMLEGQAGAINQAGSLRMQAHRTLVAALAADGRDATADREAVAAAEAEFYRRLVSPRLVEVLPAAETHPLRQSYDLVVATWEEACRPLMDRYLVDVARLGASPAAAGPQWLATLAAGRSHLVANVDGFVQRIESLVNLLEQTTEARVRLLSLLQVGTLLLTLVLVGLAMFFMQRDVVLPLSRLLDFAERSRRGDLSQRLSHTGADELGRLGHAFNRMAEDLAKLYTSLEARVADQTAELQRSNQALGLLYHTLARLNEGPVSDETFTQLLREIEETVSLRPAALCLRDPGQSEARVRASTYGEAPDTRPPGCTAPACEPCMAGTEARLRALPATTHTGDGCLLSVPLADQERSYGVLTLSVPDGVQVDAWQVRLLEAVGRHVGMAIGNAGRIAQDRRMALIEERTAIARELHDSLAQSLSYLKIQVTRLKSLLGGDGGDAEVLAVVSELRSGLNEAYRQLRELLTTFRLQLDGRGLRRALEETVAEFRQRTTGTILFEHRLGGCPLSPNEELHVLHLVREALSNVVRHARATRTVVAVICADDGMLTARVEDNGIGLPAEPSRPHHYGLTIMRERARDLGGSLALERPPDGGTRVHLRFLPVANRGQPAPAPGVPGVQGV